MKTLMTLVSRLPAAISDRSPGGSVYRAINRDNRLRSLIEAYRRADGGYELRDELAYCFERAFQKTVQGLYFGLYGRFVDGKELRLLSIEDQQFVTPDQVVLRSRPNPLEDITDQPLSDITPSAWMIREPIFIAEPAPVGGGDSIKRIFRMKRNTPVEWVEVQEGLFRFTVVQTDDGSAVCILDLWNTLVVAVEAPWPGDRGPLRRGRRNRLSRDPRKSTNPPKIARRRSPAKE